MNAFMKTMVSLHKIMSERKISFKKRNADGVESIDPTFVESFAGLIEGIEMRIVSRHQYRFIGR